MNIKKTWLFLFLFCWFLPLLPVLGKVDLKKKMNLKESFFYYKAMGDYHRILKEDAAAIKYYEYALTLNGECAECYYQIGRIKYQKKLYIDAIQELEMAIGKPFAYHYDRMKSYYLLATIYFETKREGKALQILQFLAEEYETFVKRSYQAKLIVPAHYAPAFFLIGLYKRNNNQITDEATKYFVKAMELNYKKDFANYFLYEYYRQKSPDIAFHYLNQAITINPHIQQDLQEAKWIKNYGIYEEMEKY